MSAPVIAREREFVTWVRPIGPRVPDRLKRVGGCLMYAWGVNRLDRCTPAVVGVALTWQRGYAAARRARKRLERPPRRWSAWR